MFLNTAKNTIYLLLLLTLFLISLSSIGQGQKSTEGHSFKKDFKKDLEYVSDLEAISMDTAIYQLDQLIKKYKLNDTAVARLLSHKAYFLSNKMEFTEALEVSYQALKVQKKLLDTASMAYSLDGIARVNIQIKRFEEAEKQILKSIEYYTLLKDTSRIVNGIQNLGALEQERGNDQKALVLFKKAADLGKTKNLTNRLCLIYYNIAAFYSVDEENTDSFNKYILLSWDILKQAQMGRIKVTVKVMLTQYFINKENFSKAVNNAKNAIEEIQRINYQEIAPHATYILSQAYLKNKQYKEAYETHEEYTELRLSLDSLNNVKDIAEIEEKYKNAENQIEIANLKAANLESQNAAQRFRFIAVSALLLLLILGAIFLFLNYRKRQKIKLNDSEVKTELERLKLIALRSKMNPHFLFNCINTAQNFILSAKKQDAYEYLEKFAKLLRKVLDSSPSLHISLEDEISQLRLYLELESIRANNGFKYELSVDEELENGVYEIPGMILQPFVENAIIHGVSNLENKEGAIRIALKKDRNRLHVEIEDNGVGREVAMKIKRKKDTKFKSIAIPNIKERLAIMKENGFSDIFIEVEDLIKGNMPNGTKVKVNIELD